MSPLPGCYRMYSTRYRGIPVRAVPISVITALISRKFSPLPRFFRGLLQYYRGIIHAAAVYTARAEVDAQCDKLRGQVGRSNVDRRNYCQLLIRPTTAEVIALKHLGRGPIPIYQISYDLS